MDWQTALAEAIQIVKAKRQQVSYEKAVIYALYALIGLAIVGAILEVVKLTRKGGGDSSPSLSLENEELRRENLSLLRRNAILQAASKE